MKEGLKARRMQVRSGDLVVVVVTETRVFKAESSLSSITVQQERGGRKAGM